MNYADTKSGNAGNFHNEEIMEKWKNEIAGEREAAKRKEELEEFFW